MTPGYVDHFERDQQALRLGEITVTGESLQNITKTPNRFLLAKAQQCPHVFLSEQGPETRLKPAHERLIARHTGGSLWTS
ncbi:hypothetical protein [Aromatoleum diolicum]|uniref:Uncharacterized protein n=1 Tax=Aromatoleum diolicum TaxID=75796 RepID=A0ABX1QJD6_9RHOO|nr:hypothetical protein [Aromatoleum diolicum]NMG77380.1 hypothetical protein [Aromatoleum diolicum]